MTKKRIHVYVSGRVQGVYYRQNALKVAADLGVYGWTKNLNDGRVELLIEGDKDAVETMVEWCKKGPMFARVSQLQCLEEEYKGEYDNFSVKHN